MVTYPSHGEGLGLGMKLLRDYIRRTRRRRRHQTTTLLKSLAQTLVGFVYLPLLFRPKRKSYSLSELKEMISELTTGDFQIEEYTLYNDFIVYGKNKLKEES